MNEKLLAEAQSVANMTGRRVQMRIPSVLATGEEFALDISVTGAGGLPDPGFRNVLRFENSSGVEGLPASFRLDPGLSTGRIEGLTAIGPEVVSIRAAAEGTGKVDGDPAVESNPAWVFDDPAYRLFWGDIHVHTRYSNCSGWRCLDPEWCYQYAREISLLDFAAPADHLRGIVSDDSRWPALQALAREYNDAGRFVALLAFESSHAQGFGGDNNVYYLDDDAPHFWVDRDDMRGISPEVHLRDLWKQLDGNGKPYITIPHHTGRSGKYRTWEEDYHDPEREPLFEVFSSWGSSEMRWSRFPITGGNNDEATYFVDALKAGARFGVIASSDDHATLPGAVHQHRIQPFQPATLNDMPQQGLAAVRASELTRGALFDAMKRRDTYATTLARSLVDFRIGDASMGQEVPADAALRSKREMRVRLTLPGARRARVSVMRNGEPLAEKSLQLDFDETVGVAEVVFEDAEPLERVLIRDARYHADPFVVYYVRIVDERGSHQWTSPIWIDAE